MKFKFNFDDGSAVYYDNDDNSFTKSDGSTAVDLWRPATGLEALKVSPDTPIKKQKHIATLKIQLGMKCNYKCSYCLQSSQIPDATIASDADAKHFIDSLDSWLVGSPQRIEFWGGEPLLYWKKLSYLVPKLREKFPTTGFSMVTNGSVLTDEIIEMLVTYGFGIAISHDGPGQHVRGPDPFDDPDKLANINKLLDAMPDRVQFNAVITPHNANIMHTVDWFHAKLGREVDVGFEGIVNDYSEAGLDASSKFTEEDYTTLQTSLMDACKDESLWKIPMFYEEVARIIERIRTRSRKEGMWQKCGMDRPDQLAVDLKGNAMTCQNVGAKGDHLLGNVYEGEVSLKNSWHWTTRRECGNCPVLQICGGGCMFQKPGSANWAETCENQFQYSMAKMAVVLYRLFGKELVGVEGLVLRPELPNLIPAVQVE